MINIVKFYYYQKEEGNWIDIGNNYLAFYGTGGFGTPVNKDRYNSTMHIRTPDNLDLCKKPHLTNLQYIDDYRVKINNVDIKSLSEIDKTDLIKIVVYSYKPIKIDLAKFILFRDSLENKVDNPQVYIFIKGQNRWNVIDKDKGYTIRFSDRNTKSKINELYFGISVLNKEDIKDNIQFNLGVLFRYIKE